MKFKTKQELFWIGKFGNQYIKRNNKTNRMLTIGKNLLKNNVKANSVIELGANIGSNLDAIKKIYPSASILGIEINKKAYKILKNKHSSINESILDFKIKKKFDLVIIAGVLIHQNPNYLKRIYKSMYSLTKKYIYISEYFNPEPVTVKYHGNKDRLFKRDFAKELWKLYPKLKLINYGFEWKEDPKLKNVSDNSNWFLFKK
tara:strand:+ start:274 stop:879 length:606 start_codon:yes stop_codon:yes gene_type:complete